MKELCGEAILPILPIFGEYSYIRQNINSTDRPVNFDVVDVLKPPEQTVREP